MARPNLQETFPTSCGETSFITALLSLGCWHYGLLTCMVSMHESIDGLEGILRIYFAFQGSFTKM